MRFPASLALATALFAVARSLAAQNMPPLPGIRPGDHRVVVDPSQPPWNAVAKIQTNIGSRCTGVLIDAKTVLTAAHCLYNPRTRAMLQAVSLHVLLGYQRGQFLWHRFVARYSTGAGFDGQKSAPRTSDWARLELAEAVPDTVTPLPSTAKALPSGTSVMIAGYNQDRAQLLMADRECHVGPVTPVSGGTLLLHDCSATRGTSGGPLLARENDRWVVAGINIAGGELANLALALPLQQ